MQTVTSNRNADQPSLNSVTVSTAYMYESKNGGKDQETIQSNTTPDPGSHMGT